MDREHHSPSPGAPGDERHPTHLGQYEVVRELGRGGMGVVYLARDPKLDRLVAIKVLPETLERDRDRLGRFEREARVLASLNHTNIASIYSVDQTPSGARLLVLEYIEGQTLADLLLRAPITVKEALRICAQIARAIAAAHGKGIIHRDIKPGNVMVTSDGHVKVLDFGLSTRVTNPDTEGVTEFQTASLATMPGRVMGTAGYMSPEQARGKPVDKPTDIWAFGCILYKCLSGQHVFAGETTTDVIVATLSTEPDWERLPPTTPDRIRRLLTSCLEKSPDDRIENISLALAEVEEAMVELEKGGGLVNARFGDYQVVEELHRGPAATVCLVRSRPSRDRAGALPDGRSSDGGSDGDGACAGIAKIIEPSPMVLGPDQATAHCRDFLQGVTTQKRAAANDPEHWAPVIASGRASTAAYWVTERFQRSAADIARFREPLGGAELKNIIGRVVAGLQALKAISNRPHGNLKPTNVLIADGDDPTVSALAAARVVLADPLSDANVRARNRTERDDMRDVGRMIHLLVLHREWGGENASIPFGPEWNRLGRHGRTWHGLCAKLLGPEPDAISLDDLARAVDRLKAARPPKRMVAYGAAAVACLAIVLLIFVPSWGGSADTTSGSGTPAPGVGPGDPGSTNGDDPAPPRASWVEALSSPDSLRRLAPLVADLLAGSPLEPANVHDVVTRRLDQLRDVADRFEARGLTAAARRVADVELARLDDDLGALGAASDLRETERSIRLVLDTMGEAGSVVQQGVRICEGFDRLDERAAAILVAAAERAPWSDPRNEPLLYAFRGAVVTNLAEVSALDMLEREIADWTVTAGSIHQLVQTYWHRVDHAYMRTASSLLRDFDPRKVNHDEYDQALIQLEDEIGEFFLLAEDDDPRKRSAFTGLSAQIEEYVQRYRTSRRREELPVGLQGRYDNLLQRIAECDGTRWTGTRAGRDDLMSEIDALRVEVTRFTDLIAGQLALHAGTCEDELLALLNDTDFEAELAASPVLLETWRRERGMLHAAGNGGLGAADDCGERHERAIMIKAHLEDCLTAFEPLPVPPQWSEVAHRRDEIQRISRQRVDSMLSDLLGEQAGGGGAGDQSAARLHAARTEHAAWRQAARELLLDAARIDVALSDAFGPHHPLENRLTAVETAQRWPELNEMPEAIVPIMREMTERLEALSRPPVDRSARRRLALDESNRPELRIEAWRWLDHEIDHPDALEEELEVSRAIESLLRRSRAEPAGALSQARREALDHEMRETRERRWSAHARSGESGLARAAERMEEFAIVEADLDHGLRFSLRLLGVKRHVAEHQDDEEKLRASAAEFLGWLDPLAEELGERPMALRDRLKDILGDEAPGTDWTRIGPGKLGWEYRPLDEEKLLIEYAPPADWTNSIPLTFRRVTADDAEEARYLCTVELPLGVIMDALRAGDRSDWGRLHVPSRRGARVWELGEDAPLMPATAWATPQEYESSVRQLATQGPGTLHPMQYISADSAREIARLFGGELPTRSDWLAAYQQDESAARSGVNLRAAAWQAQDGYLRQIVERNPLSSAVGRREAHRQDIFSGGAPPGSEAVWTERLAEHRFELNDRLWFHEVNAGEGERIERFRDLIGNVAEFVVAHRDTDEVLVIGGSALSPADMHRIDNGRIEWSVPLPAADHGRAFSDVGMRLAFSAEARETFLVRLNRALNEAEYLLAGGP